MDDVLLSLADVDDVLLSLYLVVRAKQDAAHEPT